MNSDTSYFKKVDTRPIICELCLKPQESVRFREYTIPAGQQSGRFICQDCYDIMEG